MNECDLKEAEHLLTTQIIQKLDDPGPVISVDRVNDVFGSYEKTFIHVDIKDGLRVYFEENEYAAPASREVTAKVRHLKTRRYFFFWKRYYWIKKYEFHLTKSSELGKRVIQIFKDIENKEECRKIYKALMMGG